MPKKALYFEKGYKNCCNAARPPLASGSCGALPPNHYIVTFIIPFTIASLTKSELNRWFAFSWTTEKNNFCFFLAFASNCFTTLDIINSWCPCYTTDSKGPFTLE